MGIENVSHSEIIPVEKKELPSDSENIVNGKIDEGIAHFEAGMYIEAIEVFSRLLGEKEDDYVRQYLARCFFRLEKYEIASKHFTVLLSSTRYHDYATSMLATINIIWGNYNEALRRIRSLPPKPSNTVIHLYILYYIHKHTKQDWVLYDAEKLMRKISVLDLKDSIKWKYYLACGMIRQALEEYSLAKHHYETALSFAHFESDRAKILDEFGSLYLETGQLLEAEKVLMEAFSFLNNKIEIEAGINFKLLGLLERKKRDFEKARTYFQRALQILNEKETYIEAAEVSCLLMELNKSDFYMSAQCYFTVLQCEKGIDESIKENEKVINILDENVNESYVNLTSESNKQI